MGGREGVRESGREGRSKREGGRGEKGWKEGGREGGSREGEEGGRNKGQDHGGEGLQSAPHVPSRTANTRSAYTQLLYKVDTHMLQSLQSPLLPLSSPSPLPHEASSASLPPSSRGEFVSS